MTGSSSPDIAYVRCVGRAQGLTPKQKMMIVVPLVAGLVMILLYLGLFANPLVFVAVVVLYFAVTLRNRRKFNRQKEEG